LPLQQEGTWNVRTSRSGFSTDNGIDDELEIAIDGTPPAVRELKVSQEKLQLKCSAQIRDKHGITAGTVRFRAALDINGNKILDNQEMQNPQEAQGMIVDGKDDTYEGMITVGNSARDQGGKYLVWVVATDIVGNQADPKNTFQPITIRPAPNKGFINQPGNAEPGNKQEAAPKLK
jgi:hypothetical protein